jgi:hypothetical protein
MIDSGKTEPGVGFDKSEVSGAEASRVESSNPWSRQHQ